ncbi:MAG: TetR/AcrR family transcriptional regulator [Solirubrobacteraceae bacterium]
MSATGNQGVGGAQPTVPVYERLPRGPHHIDPEEVSRHQRARLQLGMADSVAARGYVRTTVKHVLTVARVSRRAFYELYENKQDCFLDTFDAIANRANEHVFATCESIEGDLAEHLLGALGALASEVLEHPNDARLMFVEIGLAGPRGPRRVARVMTNYEHRLSERLDCDAPPVLVKAVCGAVRQSICMLVREQRVHELPELNQRMLGWLLALSDPAAAGVHALMRDSARERVQAVKQCPVQTELARDDRERLMMGALRVAQEVGISQMSGIHIADSAGLSLDAFLEHFSDNDQCLHEAMELTATRLLASLPEPKLETTSWPVQVCKSLSSLLAHLAGDQLLAWTIANAGYEIGAQGKDHDLELSRKVAAKICAVIPAESVDEVVIEQIAGALWHTIWCMHAAKRTHLLAALDGYIAYLALAPIIGAEQAVAAIQETRSVSALR